jgi:PD-(D/E)XK nuclease superfamily
VKMSAKSIMQQAAPRNGSYHLAMSSDIGHTAICGLKFKLPRVMGAIPEGNESFIPGFIAHNVLESVTETIGNLWRTSPTPSSQEIMEVWNSNMQRVFGDIREKQLGNLESNIEKYISQAYGRLQGIARVLHDKMSEDPPPVRILSEITITNPSTRHEGRVDAIFQYPEYTETVEWKTYADGGVSAYDRYQTISNGMLVNYRYGRAEDDFNGNVLAIITPTKIHNPRATDLAIDAIKKARGYILQVLDGNRVRTNLPHRIVCESCSYFQPCSFYMGDKVDNEQKRMIWRRRFRVLKKRGGAHVNKFLAQRLSLAQLIELRLADSGYQIEETISLSSIGIQTITLVKKNNYHPSLLYAGESTRIIGLEPGIPLLACISCIGTIRESDNGRTTVEVYSGNPNQLKGLEILLLKTHVDLTRRELESLDFVHRNPGRIQNIAYSLLGEDMYDFAT